MTDPSIIGATNEAAALERGRKLFAGPCAFQLGVVSLSGLPEEAAPEIAFAGRSNVGKSSLLNALTGRKALARVSNTPGRTQELNFFDLNGTLRLVDLPGYGYARATRDDVDRWSKLTRDFLRGRSSLYRVCLLIDARHGPKPIDMEVMDLLDLAAVSYQIILTKADKVKPTDLHGLRNDITAAIERRPAAHPNVVATSAHTTEGLPELRAELAALAQNNAHS